MSENLENTQKRAYAAFLQNLTPFYYEPVFIFLFNDL